MTLMSSFLPPKRSQTASACVWMVHVVVLRANPILHDVLNLERVVAKLCLGSLGILLVEIEHLLLQVRSNLHNLVGA